MVGKFNPIMLPSCMLTPAGCLTDEEAAKLMEKGMWMQPKIDGVRIRLLLVPNDSNRLILSKATTRSGDLIENNLFNILSDIIDGKISCGSIVTAVLLEGEFLYDKDMQKSAGIVHSKHINIDSSLCEVFLFDSLTRTDKWEVADKYSTRFADTIRAWELIDDLRIQLLPVLQHNEDDVEKSFDEMTRYVLNWCQFRQLDFEGIMFKKPDAGYVTGRTSMIQRWKRQLETEATVVDVIEMETFDNKPTGMAGALIMRSDKWEQVFRASTSPLTHDIRKKVWENKEVLIGETFTISYMAFGNKDAPRMPRISKQDIVKFFFGD